MCVCMLNFMDNPKDVKLFVENYLCRMVLLICNENLSPYFLNLQPSYSIQKKDKKTKEQA